MTAIATTIGVQEIKQQGFQAYRAKKYREALSCFEFCLHRNPSDERMRFYLGRTLIALGLHARAAREFEQVREWRNHLKSPVLWYLALAYSKIGNSIEAIVLLNKLIDNSSVFSQKANLLLKDLKHHYQLI